MIIDSVLPSYHQHSRVENAQFAFEPLDRSPGHPVTVTGAAVPGEWTLLVRAFTVYPWIRWEGTELSRSSTDFGHSGPKFSM